MKLEPLPPIPSPPAHHWRQFRVNLLPALSFLVVLGLTVWLWTVNMTNPLLFGTAESNLADIACSQPGRIARLMVTPYQDVKMGDVIAIVDPLNPGVLTNTLNRIRAEMEVIRADAGADQGDKVRYAQYQLDWMLERAELAVLKSQLHWAENEFQRISKLAKEKVTDESALETAQRDMEQARLAIEEKTAVVAAASKTLQTLDPEKSSDDSRSVRAGLAVAEMELRLAEAELQPIVLTAPITGRVSRVNKFAGSSVAQNETIVTISDPKVDRILGYVAQPIRVEPKVGMAVELRTRGAQRVVARSLITHVGPRVEFFTAPLRVRGMGAAQERGLPFVVSVPPEMNLLPGELVDVSLVLKKPNGS